MVYALQKFYHYLLGPHFRFFTDHYVIHYLVKNLVLGGRICRWLLLFQELHFEVIIKLGKQNVGLHHLVHLKYGEVLGSLDDAFPNPHLLKVDAIAAQFANIVTYLITHRALEDGLLCKRNNW